MKLKSFALLASGTALILNAQIIRAATITAATCNKEDVRTAIRAASNGDTVVLPACQAGVHWTETNTEMVGGVPLASGGIGSYCAYKNGPVNGSYFDWSFCNSTASGDTKHITIQGAGVGQTIIYDDVAKTADPAPLILWQTSAGGLSRITGIEFRVGTANCGGSDQVGSINISGIGDQVRLDHNTFVSASGCNPMVIGDDFGSYLRGVLDHNTINCSQRTVCLYFKTGSHWGNVGALGDNSWAQPDTVGTAEAMFLEDNILLNDESVYTITANPFCVDGDKGSRVVVRHNDIRACSIGMHGTDSGLRSARQIEFYKNAFHAPDGVSAWNFRGILQSSVMSTRGGVAVIFGNTISMTNGTLIGAFDGSNFRDAIGSAGQTWQPWGLCNGTSAYDQNTPGQTGWRCLDQVGSGYGQLMDSSVAAPYIVSTGLPGWPNQVAQPGYVWNNTVNGSFAGANGTTAHVVVGRDLINGVRSLKGNGTTYCTDGNNCMTTDPFTYPHPLVSGQSQPIAAVPAKPSGLALR